MSRRVAGEVTKFSKYGLLLRAPLTMANIKKFSWSGLAQEAREHMPILCNVIQHALPSAKQKAKRMSYRGGKWRTRQASTDEAQRVLTQRLALIACIIAFTASEKKCAFFQTVLGLQLWRNGCSKKVNTLSICIQSFMLM
ncbi:hypothetical protein BaRGS_00010639 [Batillaria attramentaria]|uniref:Uncharacterized protein n=1 Tax=Batillaria attramentaria TaxID=370345 RepID=A0ABD0LFA6_9CAEN